jgi:hypothetical protein
VATAIGNKARGRLRLAGLRIDSSLSEAEACGASTPRNLGASKAGGAFLFVLLWPANLGEFGRHDELAGED